MAKECFAMRRGLANHTQLHRIDVGWRFALHGIHDVATVDAQYNLNSLVGLPTRVVRVFIGLEDRLEHAISIRTRDTHNVRERLRRDISLPLAHLCCLTATELVRTRVAVDNWVKQVKFKLPLELTHVSCWREQHDAVRNGIIVDNTSQLRLLRLNHALTTAVVAAGVPIFIDRSQQMRFHIPLIAFYTKNNNSIEPLLDDMSRGITDINRNIDINLHIDTAPHVWEADEL